MAATPSPAGAGEETNVRVAVRVRPQSNNEQNEGLKICTVVMPETRQILLGPEKSFTFDLVFDTQTNQDQMFQNCVAVLVDGTLNGYNATILAYGQTGSGKTYTMGTASMDTADDNVGIIPRAVNRLFEKIEELKDACRNKNIIAPDFKVSAQFLELYNEEMNDLLHPSGKNSSVKSNIRIHEEGGNIYVSGASSRPVNNSEDCLKCLQIGSFNRVTASTNMNATSSRSHAIFTLTVKQQRLSRTVESTSGDTSGVNDDIDNSELDFETLTAKFHFVDLAGSERLKRTGATGDRAKEGISINCELLALGNVISALGDVTKRGSYVPYRNSKLTRFLQDSLGGNSRTLMIACVGPSDRDFMETLNTLVYANRARNIKNKPSVNQDKASKQVSELKKRISELEVELLQYKQGKLTADVCFMNDVSDENKLLLREQENLREKIRNLQATIESKTEEISIIKSERDLAILNSKIKVKSSANNDENAHSNAIDELITQYMGEMERVKSKLTQVEIENNSYRKQLANLKSEKIIPSMQLSNQFTNQTINNQTNVDFTKIKEFENDVTKVLAVAEADLAKKKEKLQSTCSNLETAGQISRSEGRSSSSGRRRKRNKSLTNKNKKMSSRGSSVATSCDERSLSESISEKSNEILTINGPEVDIDDVSNADDDLKSSTHDNDHSVGESDDGDDTIDEDDDNDFFDSDADYNENIDDKTESRLKISDIAYITEEISVKEQLIEQLEKSQYALNSMRQGYDNKIAQLMAKLQNLETDKQNQLKNKDGSRKNAADVERIEKEYKRKVAALESEMKKLKSFEKINKKHLSELKRNEEKILALKNDVEAKKAEKAKLVKQMKEESKRFREKEIVQRKEVAQLKKHQRQQDNKIRALETENKQKNVVLQQKLREMEVIRKNKKPMSDKVAGIAPEIGSRSRTAVGIKTSTSSFRGGKSVEQHRSLSFRGKRGHNSELVVAKVVSGSRAAPISWEKFCSVLDEYVENSYSLAFSEKEMDENIKERNRWNSEQKGVMNKLTTAKGNASRDPNCKVIISRLNDELEVIKCSIEEIQDRIEEKQASIVALNSARESFSELDPEKMDGKTAKFLLQQMINLSVERGVQQREEAVKIKELEAQISEAELNKTIQQQLLDFVILDDQQVSENNNERNILDNMNCTFIKDAPDIVSSSINSRTEAFGNDDNSSQVPWDNQPGITTRKNKKRVTVDEMLYPRESLESAKKESETPLMDKFGFQVMSAEELAKCESSLSFASLSRDNSISRVESSSNTSLVNEDSPNISSHSNKKAISLRCGLDSPDNDVFQRLLRTVPRIDLGNGPSQMEVGSINFYRGSIPGLSSFPLKCQHVAEGHKKGVVSVDATESNLFTGSIDRSVKLWDLQTGSEIMSLFGFPHTVLQVRYHLPRKMLFTSSLHVIKVWDPLCKQSEMQCIQVLKSSGSCALAQDYPTPPTTKMPQGEDQINDIAFSSCGNLLYSVARNFIRIWDLRKLPQSTESIQLLPMESHKATINVLSVKKREGPDLIFTGSRDHTIKCYEAISEPHSEGVCRSLDPPHMDGVESMCMYRDWLFTGSRDRCIKKWDISSIYSCRNISTSTNAHNHWITAMTMFSPNSSKGNTSAADSSDTPYLISGCRSGEIKVWDCSNFKSLGELKAHKAQINAFAKNSTCLFSASGDWDVKIWTRSSDSGSSEI